MEGLRGQGREAGPKQGRAPEGRAQPELHRTEKREWQRVADPRRRDDPNLSADSAQQPASPTLHVGNILLYPHDFNL